ncbi:MAG: adenosylcobinamide-GDP ribazoletransferase [Ilumatobacteraceae bacterium]
MGLLAALQFLTRVPIRLRKEPSLTRTVAWFPLAGAIIGAAVGGVAAGTWHLTPPLVAASIALTSGLLITGAFHEDGLGDIADAFGGGWTVERRLEILKDSRHGTYGVAAMCASIVIRVVALGSLPGPATMFAAAVAAHTMGRVAAVAMAGTMRLAGNTGLGADYGRSTTAGRAAAGCSAGLAVTALATGWWTGPLVLAAATAAIATGTLARRKIGGISGDVLGAAEQVAECLCLVVLSGLAMHHRLWWSA